MRKSILSMMLAVAMVMSLLTGVAFAEEPEYVATVNGTGYKTLQTALNAAAAGNGDVTVEILDNIDLTGVEWNPVTVSAPGYPKVTVNGNDKTITNLDDMLFAGTWAGSSSLIINDLTIAESNIVNDQEDSKGTVGVGAFIGFPQASATITLNNCHLINSRVEGGHWTGGLIGYAAGYAGNDGPVFMNLTITGCSVTGSTITGKGSAGGVIGHGSGNGWTKVVIENTEISGNTISSTGDSSVKAGSVVGTIGAAGQPSTSNGMTKTGGIFVDAQVSGNEVTSNGTAITTIYGRQGSSTGVLTLTGGTYDQYPIETGKAYALVADGYILMQDADGNWGLAEDLKGSGTQDDPILINDLEDLIIFRDKVDSCAQDGSTQYADKYIKLTDDIDLAGINWNPIGTMSGDHGSFKGVFDGAGHTIYNL
ncbi:MAG: hypothetical protein IKM07_06945, partial [Clostridia bacterium]|nr:hypothetical protein [Clostridia bacterium]